MANDEISAEMSKARQLFGKWVLFGSLAIMALLCLGIIVGTIIFFYGGKLEAQQAVAALQSLLSAVLPLLGAWIGALIAFYFARENLEAATQNTKALLSEINRPGLESIPASDVMIPLAKLTVVRTSEDKDKSLFSDILPRFRARSLSRVPVMGDNDIGQGVFHDSTLLQFVMDKKTVAGDAAADPKLSDAIGDAEMRKVLDGSVAYVPANASLASVKETMENQAKTAGISCKDAFVTEDGKKTGKVIGYLSDVDISKRGAFK